MRSFSSEELPMEPLPEGFEYPPAYCPGCDGQNTLAVGIRQGRLVYRCLGRRAVPGRHRSVPCEATFFADTSRLGNERIPEAVVG